MVVLALIARYHGMARCVFIGSIIPCFASFASLHFTSLQSRDEKIENTSSPNDDEESCKSAMEAEEVTLGYLVTRGDAEGEGETIINEAFVVLGDHWFRSNG